MNKIKLLEEIANATEDDRKELVARLLHAMNSRMGVTGDITEELVTLLVNDIATDYLIDKEEKAL